MTNQTLPPNPNQEHHDEAIAIFVALMALGTVFLLGVTRNARINAHVSSTPLGGLTHLILSGEAKLTASEDNNNGRKRLRFPFLGGGQSSTDTAKQTMDGEHVNTSIDQDSSRYPSKKEDTKTSPNDNSPKDSDRVINTMIGDRQDPTDPAHSGLDTGVDNTNNSANNHNDPSNIDENSNNLNENDSTSNTADPAIDPTENQPELAEETPDEEFKDVTPQYWATPFIEGLRQKEIATGFVGGDFEPDSLITRAQFANQLDRAFTHNERVSLRNYSDVPKDHPQHDAINRVSLSGFMYGYDVGDFRPDNDVSRMEVLLALVTGLELKTTSDPATILQTTYQDANQVPQWAWDKMATATELGMVVFGDNSDTFAPFKPATRAEAAAMLYQALVYLGEAPAVESEYIVRPQ